jgi:hypothetical protein
MAATRNSTEAFPCLKTVADWVAQVVDLPDVGESILLMVRHTVAISVRGRRLVVEHLGVGVVDRGGPTSIGDRPTPSLPLDPTGALSTAR